MIENKWRYDSSIPFLASAQFISSRSFSLPEMFETTERCCLARIGEWFIEGKEVETPNVLFLASSKVHPPEEAEILLARERIKTSKLLVLDEGSVFLPSSFDQTNSIPPDLPYPMVCDELGGTDEETSSSRFVVLHGKTETISRAAKSSKAEVVILGNSVELLRHPDEFARRIVALRKAVGYQRLIYTPGIAIPSNLSFLVYCGIDLVDSTRLVVESGLGRFHTSDGSWLLDGRRIFCHCPACMEGKGLLAHNYYALVEELSLVKSCIETGRLRELVERRVLSDPWMVSVLRHLDLRFYAHQELHFRISKGKVEAFSRQSLTRPDVVRFRERLKERYSKPKSASVLLLIPCSARKPYSSSVSHRALQRAVSSAGNPYAVHELVVTSPLSLVPRELELFYPAQNYDIPVTGDWSEDEKKMVTEDLEAYLEENRYEAVLAHLPPELHFAAEIAGAEITCKNSPTSTQSLRSLTKSLSDRLDERERVPFRRRLLEDLANFAVFQFGPAGKKLLEDAKIRGRYPNLRIMSPRGQVGMLVGSQGKISLAMEGGRVLAREKVYCVEIEDFYPEGNIFALGVLDADPNIRRGDEVVACYDGEVRAVGTAVMPPSEMIESERGEAIRVRHKLRKV